MDEQASLRHVAPSLAARIERIESAYIRLEKRVKALEAKKPVVLNGNPTQYQIERAIHDMKDEA